MPPVVTSGKAVLGLISEREIVHAFSRYGETAASMPVKEIMRYGAMPLVGYLAAGRPEANARFVAASNLPLREVWRGGRAIRGTCALSQLAFVQIGRAHV